MSSDVCQRFPLQPKETQLWYPVENKIEIKISEHFNHFNHNENQLQKKKKNLKWNWEMIWAKLEYKKQKLKEYNISLVIQINRGQL